MSFNFVKLESLNFDLSSANVDGIRKYTTPQGKRYPSVTSVLSYGKDKTAIYEWRNRIGAEAANKITQKSANRGTKLHTICEKYLLNELSPMKIRSLMPDVKDFFSQLRPHIDKNIGKIYGLEQSLYSDRLRLAGRTDCIAEWAGKLSIVDYKNSIKEKKDWGTSYIGPYDPEQTFSATLTKKGHETVAPNSWHFGKKGHSFWARFMLQYCINNKFL
jgi:genome maintenance exonuclease 1